MKIKEYECYRSFYCGLCKTLKKRYGLFASFALNYDAALLGLLYKALDENRKTVNFCRERCPFCPHKKNLIAKEDKALSFAADTLMIMTRFKLSDSLKDKGFAEKISAVLAFPLFSFYGRKAKKYNPILFEVIKEGTEKTKEAEKAGADTDAAASGTAYMMGEVMRFLPGDKDKNYRLGLLLGRFIYLADAADDLKKDIKRGNFNPFKGKSKQDAERALSMTLSAVTEAYEYIGVFDMKSITDNVFYLGLRNVAESIFKERKSEKDERSV